MKHQKSVLINQVFTYSFCADPPLPLPTQIKTYYPWYTAMGWESVLVCLWLCAVTARWVGWT